MILYYAPYKLTPLHSLNRVSQSVERDGVLLKVQWPDGRVGYADLHVWPELGDLSIEETLSLLRAGKMSALVEQSIWMARRDADLRRQDKSIFDLGVKVRNNFVVTDFRSLKEGELDHIKHEGFHCLKVKMGHDLQEESSFLTRAAQKNFSLRLDMNGIGSWQIFEKFITDLDPKTLALIEYVEDPFPYNEKEWIEANSLVRIALDNQYDRVSWDLAKWQSLTTKPFDVVILKPAKQDVDLVMKQCLDFDLQTTVTSYMGHPVGMIHALGIAMELKKKHGDRILDAGCLTHRLYHMEAFAAEIPFHGPFIARVPGVGIGFDELLEKQSWYQIKLR